MPSYFAIFEVVPKTNPKTKPTQAALTDFFSLDVSPSVFDLYRRANERRIQRTQRAMPSKLYHYTSPAGLLGIVENNKLWATHTSYLNDASELSYACDLVQSALGRRAESTRSANAREFLRRAAETFDVSRTMDVFVACFCEDGDLLSQWRGYAHAGQGYSIGVNADVLGKIGSGLNFFFANVVYNRALQEETINEILSACTEGADHLTTGLQAARASKVIDELCHVFRRAIWFPLVTFKDATFEEENEWRAIKIMTRVEAEKHTRFRSTASKVIPYIELDFSKMQPVSPYPPIDKLPIVEVFHGPTLNPGLSAQALRMLLSQRDQGGVQVMGSRVPLRL